jgi:membrane-bound serine protease (ClpP class)
MPSPRHTTAAPRARSRPRLLRHLLAAFATAWLFLAPAVHGQSGSVVVLTATGVVDNVMAAYLAEGIAIAERDDATAVVVRLNTPGGSLDATQHIVSAFLEARVPVIVWVSPAGGRAASAGTFITLAANLAYMAPGTNIGAATPINSEGGDIEGDLGEKVRNDAIANITSIAEARGRPVDWAVSTVDKAISSPATEALEVGAIDGIAATLDEVFAAADGREVTVAGGGLRVLDLAAAAVDETAMNPFQAFLHLLSDPNIAFLLFTAGFYGLIFELQSPNFVTGVLGALAIILGLIGFGSLPLNVGGLLLIGLGIVLIGLELTVTSHGLLTVAGIVCFVLGASALYTTPGDPIAPALEVAPPLLLTMAITTAAFGVLIVYGVIRSRRVSMAVAGGATVAIGAPGQVRSPLVPLGSVSAGGEEWTARTADGRPLARGTPVRVVAVDGLTLTVEPDPSAEPR